MQKNSGHQAVFSTPVSRRTRVVLTLPQTPRSTLSEQPQTSHTGKPPRIHLAQPVIDNEMVEAAVHALKSEKLVLGESVYKFEEEFATYCGTKQAVSTSSGTAALQIALEATGRVPGHEVLTTPFSFIATSNVVIHTGGTPVFADVEDLGFNLSPENVRQSFTSKTSAIIPVHLYGRPCAMDEFREIADEKDSFLLEDACQAHGASFGGRKVGTIGDAGCFSFYPAKNMTVGGDGGMITTNDSDLADVARSIRDCGREKNSKYSMSRIGYTSRLNSVNAAVGRVQLRKLDHWNLLRRQAAELYRRELGGVGNIALPSKDNGRESSVFHMFVIRSRLRDRIRSFLENNGVETGIHYPIPIHLQAPYRKAYGYSEGRFPTSEKLSGEVLSLPMYPGLTEQQIVNISQLIKQSLKAPN